ncbi:MAG: Gfo/Idh/MocA family oxidoreductase [Trueperaceae bacterium]|nr:MAG: Gfo/Idh/MocA family oxidoreductase [Trueperaceae bacterium]
MSVQKRIEVGIAGLGRSGWDLHAKTLSHLSMYNVSAVMDPVVQRCDEAKKRFGCKTFERFDDLIAQELDLVVVASPSYQHAEQGIRALYAGKNVLIEKPMGCDLTEAEALVEAAVKMGKLLTVNQNYRYRPAFRKVNEVVASGVLGTLVQIRFAVHDFARRWDWQTLRGYGGGILNNHGAHLIDWALHFFDDEEPKISGALVNTPLYAGDAESHAKIVIVPGDGPLIDLELTHCNAFPQDNWVVMGTQGSLTGTDHRLRWKYFDVTQVPPIKLDMAPTPDRSYNREELPWITEELVLPTDMSDDMVGLYRDLYETLCHDKPLAITPESVLRQMKVLERCRELPTPQTR